MAGAAGAGLALGGCQAYGTRSGGVQPPAAGAPTGSAQSSGAPSASGSAAPGTPAPGAGGPALAKTADIPVGGGTIFKDRGVVVTQPQAGTFKAFSAACTHAGCTVTAVANGTINCDCHNSRFRITDGAPAGGPAAKPLAAKTVTVDGDSLRLG
jgi:Rieske Fe-S protein